jgi:stage II sporulation protein D
VRWRLAAALTAVVFLAACGGRRPPQQAPETPAAPAPGAPSPRPEPLLSAPFEPTVRVLLESGAVERLPIERYVRGTVEAESWAPRNERTEVAERLFEVQALIARTYVAANRGRHAAAGADVCTTTHCQLFRQPSPLHAHADRLDTALARSAGRLLRYDGAPILALFHSSCGGATSAAEDVWGGRARPYLRSASDAVCLTAAPWTARLERDALIAALDADPRTRVDGRLDSIDIVTRDAGDRAVLISLTGARSPLVRGEELRLVLVRRFGARSVRSTRFRIARDGRAFVLTGVGFGHGAGLCQSGALSRLRAGASVASVIAHYYPGVTIDATRTSTN